MTIVNRYGLGEGFVSMGKPKLKDKRWSVNLEHRILEELSSVSNKDTMYRFNPASDKEVYVIDTPPPYPSGTWHIGAVAQYSMIDVIARSQRLLGKEAFFTIQRSKELTKPMSSSKFEKVSPSSFAALC